MRGTSHDRDSLLHAVLVWVTTEVELKISWRNNGRLLKYKIQIVYLRSHCFKEEEKILFILFFIVSFSLLYFYTGCSSKFF